MTRGLTTLMELRRAGKVERCHGFPHHGSYSIAEHSYQMLNLLLCLHPKPTMELVEAVMYHDSAELQVGDTPRTAKSRFPDLEKALIRAEAVVNDELDIMQDRLLPSDKLWLHCLDLIELAMWCLEQIDMGNKNALAILDRVHEALDGKPMPEELQCFLKNGVLR